jgi:hypothetical protein
MAEMIRDLVNGPARRRPSTINRAGDPFGGGVPLALLAIAITLLGFWRTFFSQLGNVDFAHQLHGWLSTGWLVLVLVQASLIGFRKFKWHRVLGWSSVAVFTLLIITSCHMLTLMLAEVGPLAQPFEMAKIFGYSDVTALPLLVIAYVAAIVLRKDRHVHSRLISVTLFAGLLPAAARMFFGILVVTGLAKVGTRDEILQGLTLAIHPTYIFVLVVLGVAAIVDWRKGRLRWPFPFAFAWLAIVYATFFPCAHSQWFDYVARAIASLA